MSIDQSRLPAIVGAAQVIQRPGDWTEPADARGAIELMVDAIRDAAADTGRPALLRKVGWIGVVGGYWGHQNPGQVIAPLIGADNARTALSPMSGSSPQQLVATAATEIANGHVDVAVVTGGEARWSRRRLKLLGAQPEWNSDPGIGEPQRTSDLPAGFYDEARRLGSAVAAYALFEDSLRISRGESHDEARDRAAQQCSRFSAVASQNPFAWDRTAKTAEEIRAVSADNRMIAFPYTKAMVANNTVDMASAVILCSADLARDAGVPADRLVFPVSSTSSLETSRITERHVLHETPALATAAREALRLADVTIEEIAHVDLYSCFPSIVEMSAPSIGLDPARPLTVTGGLAFAGAPIANASGQAIAALVHRLRQEPGHGLIHANGGYASKHAFGVYSSKPLDRAFCNVDVTDQVDHRARRAAPADWDGSGIVEAATVVFDREGPTHVIAAVRTHDDGRGLVRSLDPDLIEVAMTDGLAGLAAPLPASDVV